MKKPAKRRISILLCVLLAASCLLIYGRFAGTVTAYGLEAQSGEYDGVPWEITGDGVLQIGTEGGKYTFTAKESRNLGDWPWCSESLRNSVKSVRFLGEVHGNGSHASMFRQLAAMEMIDLTNFRTEDVTDLSYFLCNDSKLEEADIAGLSLSNVTDMRGMFSGCSGLYTLEMGKSEISGVRNFSNMFYGCNALRELDLSVLSMTSECDRSYMLQGLKNLKVLTLGQKTVLSDTGLDRSYWRSPDQKTLYTAAQLMSQYDGSSMAGKYTFECKEDEHAWKKEVTQADGSTGAVIKKTCQICGKTEEETVSNHGQCGDNAFWTVTDKGVIEITGSGAMWDYQENGDPAKNEIAPWRAEGIDPVKVMIADGITRIGSYAFYSCGELEGITASEDAASSGGDAQQEKLSMPESLKEIGEKAFTGTKLRRIVFPNEITKIEKLGKMDHLEKVIFLSGWKESFSYVMFDGITQKLEIRYFYDTDTWTENRRNAIRKNADWIGVCREHQFGDWEILAEAGYQKEGLRRRECQRCGEQQEAVLEALTSEKIENPQIKLNRYSFTYSSGKKRKPEVTVSADGTELQEMEDYQILWEDDLISPGEHEAEIQFVNRYALSEKRKIQWMIIDSGMKTPQIAKIVSTDDADSGARVTWRQESGVDGYEMAFCPTITDCALPEWKKIPADKNFEDLKNPGNDYYVMLRAWRGQKGKETYSGSDLMHVRDGIYSKPDCEADRDSAGIRLKGSGKGNRVSFSWSPKNGAKKYRIFVKRTEDKKYTHIKTVKPGKKLSIKNLTKLSGKKTLGYNSSCTIRVEAVMSRKQKYYDELTVKTGPKTPKIKTLTRRGEDIFLSWSVTDQNIKSYKIQKWTGKKWRTFKKGITEKSYAIEGGTNQTAYYRVIAVNKNGVDGIASEGRKISRK